VVIWGGKVVSANLLSAGCNRTGAKVIGAWLGKSSAKLSAALKNTSYVPSLTEDIKIVNNAM